MKVSSAALLLVLIAGDAWGLGRESGGSGWRFSVGAAIGAEMGYSVSELTQTGLASSYLFPLGSVEPAINLVATSFRNHLPNWVFGLSAATNVTPPLAAMSASSWWTNSGYPGILNSYLTAPASLQSLVIAAKAEKLLLTFGSFRILLDLGYSYETMHETGSGVVGWQYSSVGNGTYSPTLVSSGGTFMMYDATFHRGFAGVSLAVDPLPSFEIALAVGYEPVYELDSEDSVAITRRSTAQGFGNGVGGSLSLQLDLGDPLSAKRPYQAFVALTVASSYEQVGTRATQTWYGSADSTTPKGTVINGIPDTVSAFRLMASVGSGIRF